MAMHDRQLMSWTHNSNIVLFFMPRTWVWTSLYAPIQDGHYHHRKQFISYVMTLMKFMDYRKKLFEQNLPWETQMLSIHLYI